jgi:hypothetical protein
MRLADRLRSDLGGSPLLIGVDKQDEQADHGDDHCDGKDGGVGRSTAASRRARRTSGCVSSTTMFRMCS